MPLRPRARAGSRSPPRVAVNARRAPSLSADPLARLASRPRPAAHSSCTTQRQKAPPRIVRSTIIAIAEHPLLLHSLPFAIDIVSPPSPPSFCAALHPQCLPLIFSPSVHEQELLHRCCFSLDASMLGLRR
uniref:Uncharacterized protein n=1 Tax=Oryza brachyantha TaxID=4533 RepID=J3MXK4_ORYBR